MKTHLVFLLLFFVIPIAQANEVVVECDSCEGCTNLARGGAREIKLTNHLEGYDGACLSVSGKNLVIDCQDFRIKGDNENSLGFEILGNSENIEIRNCIIEDNDIAIRMKGFDSVLKVLDCKIITNDKGIVFEDFVYDSKSETKKFFKPSLEMSDTQITRNRIGVEIMVWAGKTGSSASISNNFFYDNEYAIRFSQGSLDNLNFAIDGNYFNVYNCGELLKEFDCPKRGCPDIESILVPDKTSESGFTDVKCENTERLDPNLRLIYHPADDLLTVYLGGLFSVKPGHSVTLMLKDGPITLDIPDEGFKTLPVDEELARNLDGATAHFEGNSYFYPVTVELEDWSYRKTKEGSCEPVYLSGKASDAIDVVVVPISEQQLGGQGTGIFYKDEDLKKFVLDKIVDEDGDDYGIFSTMPFDSKRNLFNFWVYTGDLFEEEVPQEFIKFLEVVESQTRPGVGDSGTNIYHTCDQVKRVLTFKGCPNDIVIILVNGVYSVGPRRCAIIGYKASLYEKFNSIIFSGGKGRVVSHEFAHSMIDLKDEYLEKGGGDYPGINCADKKSDAIGAWGHFKGDGKGKFKVGYYSGCSYESDNVRPTQTSIMNSGMRKFTGETWYRGFGPFNEEVILKTLEKYNAKVLS